MSAIDRAQDFWSPEPTLDQQTAYILGNGSSLRSTDVGRFWGKKVIAINSACRMAEWARRHMGLVA